MSEYRKKLGDFLEKNYRQIDLTTLPDCCATCKSLVVVVDTVYCGVEIEDIKREIPEITEDEDAVDEGNIDPADLLCICDDFRRTTHYGYFKGEDHNE